jgi:hypothetical protein
MIQYKLLICPLLELKLQLTSLNFDTNSLSSSSSSAERTCQLYLWPSVLAHSFHNSYLGFLCCWSLEVMSSVFFRLGDWINQTVKLQSEAVTHFNLMSGMHLCIIFSCVHPVKVNRRKRDMILTCQNRYANRRKDYFVMCSPGRLWKPRLYRTLLFIYRTSKQSSW